MKCGHVSSVAVKVQQNAGRTLYVIMDIYECGRRKKGPSFSRVYVPGTWKEKDKGVVSRDYKVDAARRCVPRVTLSEVTSLK